MPVLTERLEVAWPLDDVFAFVGDFANTQDWDPGVAEARMSTDPPIGVGTRYELTVLFNSKRLPMTYEVTRWDPPNLVELKGDGKQTTAVDEIRFSATPSGGTRIDYRADIRLRWPLRIVEPVMRSKFAEVGAKAIEGMRRALDERSRAAQ